MARDWSVLESTFLSLEGFAQGRSLLDIERPDTSNRNEKEVDLIVNWSDGSKSAIEHTEAEGLEEHRKAEAALKDYEAELQTLAPPDLELVVELDPTFITVARRERANLARSIWAAISPRLQKLKSEGVTIHDRSLPGPISIVTMGILPPIIRVTSSPGQTMRHRSPLSDSIAIALGHKNERLGAYRRLGYQAVLLIEILDRTATSAQSIRRAIEGDLTEDQRENLDQLWIARGGPASGYSISQIIP